jgi:ribosomal-protein-alanine N-acetyltransferase
MAERPAGMREVETARLLLRPPQAEDLDDWYREIGSDPDVMRWLATGQAITREEAAERFPWRWLELWERDGYGAWAVTLRGGGPLIGQCGVRLVDETGETEVLYAFGRSHQGRGYATEAARASLRFGFQEVGLERIVAYARRDNGPSIRVMEKLGMAFDREDRVFDLDVVVYATDRERFHLDDGPYDVRPSS